MGTRALWRGQGYIHVSASLILMCALRHGEREEPEFRTGDPIIVVWLLSCVRLFVTTWTAACQAPLSSTISWSLLKLRSIELVMPSNHLILGEGNGNPLQCSCLENPRDGGAWWAAVYGVAQSRTRLKQLSSSSISFSVALLSSCSQSFPASGSFLMSQFFASCGQSIGASALASVLSVNIQG